MGEPVAATIVARNYLPAARVLADSYRRYHPGAEFVVLVVDADPEDLTELTADSPELCFLGPADLDLDPAEFGRMALAYSVTELCTAVKPWLLRRLLANNQVAIYLDPDIEVFGSFAGGPDGVGARAAEHGIVLTPHVLRPMPRDGLRPTEADIMASGVFNLGFIAVSMDADPFLRFWAERLRQDAISSVTEQLFTDQRWVDNVPAMFDHTVLTDPGCNVAYWNVYQRPLARTGDGTVTVGSGTAGSPLKFLHYSGYRPERPWLTSAHYADKPRVLLSEYPLLAELFDGYRRKLFDAGYRQALEDIPYGWNTLPDGTRVSPSLRRAYRQAWVDAERTGGPAPPNPFGGGDPADFLRWATEPGDPAQERAGLSRAAMALWESRLDLREVFPDPTHADAESYRFWCRGTAIPDGELPAGAVADTAPARTVPVRDTVGANVLGYLTAELGVGEMGRLVHDAVARSGLPVATAVEEFTVTNRTQHPLPVDAAAALGDPHFGVSVLCVNADMTHTTLRLHPELGEDRYVIGVWSWELSTFPESMHPIYQLVDEVWTISDFCVGAIAAHAPVPVHRFPVPVRDPLAGVEPARRASTNAGETRFLFVFDHNSIFERKNPLAAITAFRKAFGDREDVRLVLKSINGDQHPGDREQLRMAAAGDKRIELIEGYLSAEEVRQLFTTADCYVSLHRSEGFGLTVAEAMAHGLPVIATDYSGTSELLDGGTGWPIPYQLVPVGPGNGPYPADARWAEPDLDAAAAAMRAVADAPEEAARRGAAARRHVLTTRSERAAASWVRERIEQAHQQWLRRRNQRAAHGPLATVRAGREALHWRADPGAASRLPMASTMRRAVLRAIDHYDHHQRTILGALMDGVEGGVAELADTQHGLAERLDRFDRQLAASRSAQDAAHTDLAERLAELVERMNREVTASRAQHQAVHDRLDALDRKLMGLLHERDRRISAVEAAAGDLATEVPLLREGLLRHHDLVNPDPDGSSTAVATDIGPLRLPAEDTVLLPWLRRYGNWEADESRLIELLLPPGGVFVDVGAHVGYLTIRGLRAVGAAGTVVALEPWQRVRGLLERNVAANVSDELAAALTVVPAAAWHTDGPLRLALAADGNSGDNRVSADGGLEIDGVRLDGLPALRGRRVDVVKCDAQGRDHLALGGMTGLLAEHRPHVLVEFWPQGIADGGDDPAEVLAGYRKWGYQPVPVTAELVDRLIAAGGRAAAGVFEPAELEDAELIEAALAAAPAPTEGFLTLWLRPR